MTVVTATPRSNLVILAVDNAAPGASNLALLETPQGATFTLTPFADIGPGFTGTAGDDTFNSTYDAAVTDTFNIGDMLIGNGGTDTLNISHIIDVALTPPDALWAGLSSIENVVFSTTGNGAQTLTTGTQFEHAFADNGVDLTMTTLGSGAINVTSTSYTGALTLTTTSLAGAQTIMGGTGTTVVNATSTAGALTIKGAGIEAVTALTTGAGAQTILSSSSNDVTVLATTGAGALTVVTGAGNDTITLFSSDVAGANVITGNAGADAITLVTGSFAAAELIIIGDADSGLTVSTADSIVNFVSGSDQLKMGTTAVATALIGNYVEAGTAVGDFAAALVAANTALALLADTSGATEMFAFQFDGSNGYLFNDTGGDGTADQVIVLVGIDNTGITAADIIC